MHGKSPTNGGFGVQSRVVVGLSPKVLLWYRVVADSRGAFLLRLRKGKKGVGLTFGLQPLT